MKQNISRTMVIGAAMFALSAANGQTLQDAYRSFSFSLFDELENYQYMCNCPPENVVISPLSAQFALGMLLNGANGNTLAQIKETLQVEDFATGQINEYNRMLMRDMPKTSGAEWITENDELWEFYRESVPVLEFANGIWADDGVELLGSFIEANRTNYDAEIETIDLSLQESMDRIDEWLGGKTHGQIPSAGVKPDDALKMLLVDATYFKGGWACPFEEYFTTDGVFNNGGTLPVTLPMMHQRILTNYASVDGMQAVKLYYGYDSKFSMTLYISDNTAALKSLGSDQWQAVQESMQTKSVEITLPRFETDCEFDLNMMLKNLGMVDAYNPTLADFSAMTDYRLFVGNVKQLGRIAVDEKGTVAAAATIITMDESYDPDDDVEIMHINFDHPFYFTIEDNESGTIMFMGHIHELEGEATSIENLRQQHVSSSYDIYGRKTSSRHGLMVRDGKIICVK